MKRKRKIKKKIPLRRMMKRKTEALARVRRRKIAAVAGVGRRKTEAVAGVRRRKAEAVAGVRKRIVAGARKNIAVRAKRRTEAEARRRAEAKADRGRKKRIAVSHVRKVRGVAVVARRRCTETRTRPEVKASQMLAWSISRSNCKCQGCRSYLMQACCRAVLSIILMRFRRSNTVKI